MAPLPACGSAAENASLQTTQQVALPSGPRIAVVPRPVDPVHLAVWIDAGSRDADPPQLAAVAAWMASAQLGANAEVRVLPDGTMFSLRCENARLEACLERLAGALAHRDPTDDGLRRAMRRLTSSRRRARGHAPEHADRLALRALFGDDAAGFIPLGDAREDAEVSKQRVARFLTDHYGPGRALVTAVGALDAETLAGAVEATFDGLPQARATRRARSLPLSGSDVEVAIGDTSVVTLAVAAPRLQQAAALATHLASPVSIDAPRMSEARAHAFQVRGGAIALVRVPHADPPALARQMSFRAATLLEEGASSVPLAPSEGSPEAAARWEALQWLAPEPQNGFAHEPRLAIGAVADDEAADTLSKPNARETRFQDALQRAYRSGLQDADPELQGNVDPGRVAATMANGARLEARRLASSRRVAVSIEVLGGAEHEPAAAHGRTALLATLATTACRGVPPDALRARLHQLNARFEPTMRAHAWGIHLEATGDRWREAVALATHCLREPSFRTEALRQAKARLGRRLEARDGWGRQQALRLVAPAAPGLVEPWGDAARLAALDRHDLRHFQEGSVVGSRIALAVVGPAAADEMAHTVARRVAALPRGELPALPVPGSPVSGPLAAMTDGIRPRVVVGWRTSAKQAQSPIGARAFAALAGARLLRIAEARPVWHGGDAGRWGAWAAVAVEVTENALKDLDVRVRQATAGVDDAALKRAVSRMRDRLRRQRAAARGDPARWARLLARRRAAGASSRGPEAALTTADALRQGTPHYVIARPVAQAPVAAASGIPRGSSILFGADPLLYGALDTAPSASYIGLRAAPRTERYTLPRHRPPAAFWPRLPDRVRRWRPHWYMRRHREDPGSGQAGL